MTELSQNLRSWSAENPGEQGDLAEQLALALETPGKRALWSLVDLPAEFERRKAHVQEFSLIANLKRLLPIFRTNQAAKKFLDLFGKILDFIEKILPLFYLLPIAITWYNLSEVVGKYRALSSQAGSGKIIDFLTFWSGANQDGTQYAGKDLAQVATEVFAVLVIMILLHLLTIQSESEPRNSEILRALVLESQLALAKSRAVTPDELTDTLSIAANQLKTALEQSTSSMQSMTGINDKLVSVVNTLGNVANSLSASAQKIEYSVQPLAALPGQLAEIFSSVSALPSSLSDVQREIQSSAQSLENVSHTIKTMAQINADTNEQTSAFVSNLAKAQLIASDFVSNMEKANRTIADLAGQLQDREPHMLQLRTITEQFNSSVKSLHDIAEEFRYSADQYRVVNETHRSGQ